MQIEHNSREIFYREPFGAVSCGTKVNLKLAVSGAGIPSAVRVVLVRDGEERRTDMAFLFSIGDNSIYGAEITAPEKEGLLWYYFELESDGKTVYYGNNNRQLGGKGEIFESKPSNAYQITVYREDYTTPDWFKHGVAYQIFVDRFYNGNENGGFLGDRTDIIKRKWGDTPYYKPEQFGGEYLSNDFFGGNLNGVRKKLSYLKDLGINVIYLNPIFKAFSNHKYDTGSYEEIDPMFGTEQDFKDLCEEAKSMGIRIILDGVFNHTGSDSMYFNKKGTYNTVGAYQSKESTYYSWYRFDEWPEKYESWWGMLTLPQCEEHSEEYRKYILSDENSIIKKWLRNGASGWRLDVVDELPGFFVKELRKNAKSEKADAVIIGEVWEDASNKSAYGEQREYFLGSELDSVMNYPMRDAIINFALGRISASDFDERMMSLKENYPKQAYYSLLNMMSGHDVERLMTLMSGAPSRHEVDKEYQANYRISDMETTVRRTKLAVGLQMLMPGVPCVYYGDEVGMQGYGDPFCRRTYPWGNEGEHGESLREYFKQLISLRKSSETFSVGEFETVYNIGGVYAFVRYCDNETYLIAANSGQYEKIRLDIARFGIRRMQCISCEEYHESQNGIFFAELPQYEIKIYKCHK